MNQKTVSFSHTHSFSPNILFFENFPVRLLPGYLYLFYFPTTPPRIRLSENGDFLLSAAGDLLLISKDLILSPEWSGRFFCAGCRTEHINEVIGQLLLEQNPISRFLLQAANAFRYEDYLRIHAGSDDKITAVFEKIRQEAKAEEAYSQIMQSHLFALLLTHLIRHHSGHCCRDIGAPFSEDGYRIMEEIIHSDFKLTLSDIASSQHIAPAYASRYVKKTTGVAFSKLMTAARDHVACLMLSTTPKTICAIAEQVGYENPENFVRAFKKLHHCTPGEYRKRNSSKDLL